MAIPAQGLNILAVWPSTRAPALPAHSE